MVLGEHGGEPFDSPPPPHFWSAAESEKVMAQFFQICSDIYRVALLLRVLIFAICAVFVAIRKNKFPQNKITSIFFSAKISSTVEIIYKNTDLKEKMP